MKDNFVGSNTFIVLADCTANKDIIFGKNCDRPQNEVQKLIFVSGQNYEEGSKLKCTYIEVEQIKKTYSVVLNKPSWMSYGAESGSNEFGLVVGNEPIFNCNTDENEENLLKPGLLGQDYVRLILERCKTASEAVDLVSSLLKTYGQGGLCAEKNTGHDNLVYENSFLVADTQEAWIIETVGKEWAAEKISSGYRNISNCLTITTKIDRQSENLKKVAIDKNLWNGEGEFNFYETFKSKKNNLIRFENGKELLKKLTDTKKFDIFSMLSILRNTEKDICCSKDEKFPTQSSQLSILKDNFKVHWFTSTPDPNHSVYKPIIFAKDLNISKHVSEPINESSFKHQLYTKHEKNYSKLIDKNNELNQTLRSLEENCILELLNKPNLDEQQLELNELFNDTVEAELRFYH